MVQKYLAIAAAFLVLNSASAFAIEGSSELHLASNAKRTTAANSLYARKLSPFSLDGDLRGWEHLYALLVSEGIDAGQSAAVLSDARMPPNKPLQFSVIANERADIYSRRNNRKERRNALKFYQKHRAEFAEVERKYGVPSSIILALLQVETRCGTYTGRSRIFYRLARLASAANPESIDRSLKMNRRSNPQITKQQVIDRAAWLESKFLPHLLAVFRLAKEQQIHPLELRGSIAGAVGLPQFLPGNYYEFGVDGDRDGYVDLFSAADAIHSVGNFLKSHGWSGPAISPAEQRKVLWHYNRSEPYVKTVFAMSRALKNQLN